MRYLLISALIISLTACSSSEQVTTTPASTAEYAVAMPDKFAARVSHIARKVCYPQYELTAIAYETQIAMIPKAQETRGIIEPLPTSSGVKYWLTMKKELLPSI